jgi:hypothetical protein
MACHEDIRTCFIITRSTILITIKPCQCSGKSILPWMEDVDNQFTLYKGLFQSMLISETHFHDDADVKEILNSHML